MEKLLWTQKKDIGPGTRLSFDMVFDASRGVTLCFGGQSGTNIGQPGTNILGDTWAWDGNDWTQLADFGPPVRRGHALAYDANRKCVVLFGGISGPDSQGDMHYLNDTWEWDGKTWTQMAATGPSARAFTAMAYDAKRQRTVLFGGNITDSTQFTNFGDTWSWDGNEWTEEQTTGPVTRNSHKLTFDTNRNRIVLFGGAIEMAIAQDSKALSAIINDTWEYDGLVWKQVSSIGPSLRVAYAMTFDGTNTILHGGWNLGSTKFGDTWSWDGSHWTQRQTMGPSARSSHGMAYDSTRGRMVIYGGNSDHDLSDTWEAYELPAPTVQPSQNT